jgi:uncharacterized membrane protein
VSETPADIRRQARREAAPSVLVALALLVLLAIVSKVEDWELLSWVHWWVWLLVAVPEVLLIIDLALGFGGTSLMRTRRAALLLLGVLVAANLVALCILIAGLVTTSTRQLGGGELLLTAFVIWVTDVIVFGLWFWEVDDGGPVERTRRARRTPDFQFPQDENPGLAAPGWRPEVWDYLYVSLTNSIAFSPTDAMPLSRHAKRTMGLGSVISAITILLVAARAVNVLGS